MKSNLCADRPRNASGETRGRERAALALHSEAGGESETLEGSAAASETGTEMSSPPGWLQNKAPRLFVPSYTSGLHSSSR